MKNYNTVIEGNLVDVFNELIFPAKIYISGEKIKRVVKNDEKYSHFILPGFIDSHIHIESSMLTPAGFAELAVKHGTVAVVSDPHEIANVAGLSGVEFMISSGRSVPLKFFFGAPSCVPATEFEQSGARLDPEDVKMLLNRDDIYFLSEMMNFPGVVSRESNVMKKIGYALEVNKPVDGHAPALGGDDLKRYIAAGISTDHETISLAEAEEKILGGMKLQIREGSAARGFDLLSGLIDRFPESVMLCSDDLHPDDILKGHINRLLERGVKMGTDLFNLIRAANVNPVRHYKLPVGSLREGDYADMVIVRDLEKFDVLETIINGEKVYSGGKVLFDREIQRLDSKFRTKQINSQEIKIQAEGRRINIIEVKDGEIYTGCRTDNAKIKEGLAVSDPERDICKIIVVNKYTNVQPVKGFISGFGLKKGAIAGSVAHDSHNIIAVGLRDEDITKAVNVVIEMKGGLAAVSSGEIIKMPLEIGGLMTNLDGHEVSRKYQELDNYAKILGSPLRAPFMSLSFMALLVIPELKIGDKGLFDVNKFGFTSLFVK